MHNGVHVGNCQNRKHGGCLQVDYQALEGKLTVRQKELLYFF